MQENAFPSVTVSPTSDTLLRTEERAKDGASYRYQLSVRESERVASFGLPLYSISVEMTDQSVTTCAKIRDCFSDEQHAFGFFRKIVENLATPIDLPYILEDERRI